MKKRAVDFLLIIVLLWGCFKFVSTQSTLRTLKAEFARIVEAVGDLKITDPSLLHATALAQTEPLDWSWHMVVPEGSSCSLAFKIGNSSGSCGFATHSHHCMPRIAIRQMPNGAMAIITQLVGASASSQLNSSEFFEFLRQNQQRLIVEQFGEKAVATVKSGDKPVNFLKVSMPNDLASEALARFNDPNIRAFIPVLIETKIELK